MNSRTPIFYNEGEYMPDFCVDIDNNQNLPKVESIMFAPIVDQY
jgi:hypothetical protein